MIRFWTENEWKPTGILTFLGKFGKMSKKLDVIQDFLRSNVRWSLGCFGCFPGRFRRLSCRSFTAASWSCSSSRSSVMRRWTRCKGCTSSCPLINTPERKRPSSWSWYFFTSICYNNFDRSDNTVIMFSEIPYFFPKAQICHDAALGCV